MKSLVCSLVFVVYSVGRENLHFILWTLISSLNSPAISCIYCVFGQSIVKTYHLGVYKVSAPRSPQKFLVSTQLYYP